MYLDISVKKIFWIALGAILLYSLVTLTFSAKQYQYGRTPFYPSIGLFVEEVLYRSIYGIAHVAESLRSTIGSDIRGLLQRSGYAAAAVQTTEKARAIPVLTYHRIIEVPDGSNTTRTTFEDQMRTLKNAGWQTITLKQYEAFMSGQISLPEKSFVITFDDGAKQSYYPVDPILKLFGYNAVSYIIVARAETAKSTYYLSVEEIARMLATGRWEIGSHSYDGHKSYAADAQGTPGNFFADRLWLPAQGRIETPEEFALRVSNDFALSKYKLESTYGITIDTFAFPFGETGLAIAGNYPEGIQKTNEIAANIYKIGWLQSTFGEFSYDYPESHEFLSKRIHVDHDWSGKELEAVMMRGYPKNMPFADDFESDRGWRRSWGSIDLKPGELTLASLPSTTGASALLDGSFLWTNYRVDADVSWYNGSALIMGYVSNSRTYYACVFDEGEARLQYANKSTERSTLATVKDSSVHVGENIRLSLTADGNKIGCSYNGKELLSVEKLERSSGGVGIQIWNRQLGVGKVVVHSIAVNPLPVP